MARGRGHCTGCDRVFVLTYKGTIPAHTFKAKHCAGSDREPRLGTVTSR